MLNLVRQEEKCRSLSFMQRNNPFTKRYKTIIMGSNKLKGKDLRKIKFPSDKVKSMVSGLLSRYYKHASKEEQIKLINDLLEDPHSFLEDETWGKVAEEMVITDGEDQQDNLEIELTSEPKPYRVFGKKFIDQSAIQQMDLAMKLPIAIDGALMPDAHGGYGLPIGGVLATANSVIPYGVGLDIGCRMSLTLYDLPENYIDRNNYQLKTTLKENTHFGVGKIQDTDEDHEILERPEFRSTELLRQLHGKAQKQLGTSGSGNHFVEFGNVVLEEGNSLGFPAGNYMGILAHSGSRGFGATIAGYYTKVAKDVCKLPRGAQHLAWLDLDTEAGQEYWMSMNLAGDYAKACHDVIHRKLAKSLGIKPLTKVENHHNFAWKESMANGKTMIVHRKGATPAAKGKLGIIPGSMTQPGYIVSGLGEATSLNSASHGAGRKLSRTKAKSSITGSMMKKLLKQERITLLGGGVDEAPMVYKDLEQVMGNQQQLVKTEGKFYPRIVRMDKG